MLNCQVLFCFDQDPTELNTFVNALKCERCGYPGVLPVQPLDLDSEWRVGMGTWSHNHINVMTVMTNGVIIISQGAHP